MNRSALALAQIALDRALGLDPEAAEILRPLVGKRIEVRITDVLPMRIMLAFTHDRIVLSEAGFAAASTTVHAGDPAENEASAAEFEADVCVTGTLGALVSLARGVAQLPSSSQVSVQGDIALLQVARTAVTRLRPDFDEPLARLLGDELAWPLSRAVRRMAGGFRRVAAELGDDIKEYIGEESALLAAREDVEDFHDDVDRLRDALARLDKRVQRLSQRATTTNNEHGAVGER